MAAIAAALGPAQASAALDSSVAFRILTKVRLDNGRRSASEVVIRLGGDEDPYRILSWQDDVTVAAHQPMASRGADDF